MNKRKPILYEYLLLLFIVLVGSILRFWDYGNIPFMHDELSALSRLQFNNFNDLIREGVMLGDTHPAGVQVFLYYWTALVGTSEIMVKLPFILSGILSIWISYLIGRLWFDGTTGLLTAACISSLQFFVMYSQIARPYASGLLITLIMVYVWSLYFFKKRKSIYLILYVLFGAMATYNHHFSLLYAAIVGISGLFIVKKKNLLEYFIAGLAIFILYIPHLHIFFTQLAQGGIGGEGGWLAKPESIFIFQFLHWVFHFSVWTWTIFIVVILYIILVRGDFVVFDNAKKKRWFLITWFILPIIIGFAYSIFLNPIIQYSMLIFSTPYLFILLFSYHKKLSQKQNTVLVLVILLVNTSTLVFERNHYNIFYKQPYEETFKKALLTYNTDDVFLIDDCIPYYHEFFFNKYNKRIPYFTKRNTNIDLTGFEKIIANIKEGKVIAEALTGEQLQIIQSYFPYQLGYENGFTYEIYTFSKMAPVDGFVIERDIIAQTDFKNEIGSWKDVKYMVEFDTLNNNSFCRMESSNEWGPSISFPLLQIAEGGLGVVDVEVEMMMLDTITNALIVATISEGEETRYWKAVNFESYNHQPNKWKKVFLSVDIQGALKSRRDMDGLVLKINIWNRAKTKLLINSITIYRKQGNPLRYSLFSQDYL